MTLAGCCNCGYKKQQVIEVTDKETEPVNPADAYTVALDTNHHEKRWMIVFETENGQDSVDTKIPITERCTLKTIRLDKKGLKEVMLTWTDVKFDDYIGDLTNFQQLFLSTYNEIWNLEDKKQVFSAISRYFYSTHSWMSTGGPSQRFNFRKDSSYYHYDLTVTDSGTLVLNNLQYRKGPEPKSPDHVGGVYQYLQGQMVLRDTTGL